MFDFDSAYCPKELPIGLHLLGGTDRQIGGQIQT